MIAAFRLASFALNLAAFVAPALLLRLPPVLALLPFPLVAWLCARAPRGAAADPAIAEEAAALAARLGAPPPRFVRVVPGWTAAAVRDGLSYGLLLGDEVEPVHRAPALAHEIAHARDGDLAFEPFTDGPARLLLPAVLRMPPLLLPLLPFFLLAIPLARATELRADRAAAEAVPSYPDVLQEVARRWGARGGLLYPSVERRRSELARHSLKNPADDQIPATHRR